MPICRVGNRVGNLKASYSSACQHLADLVSFVYQQRAPQAKGRDGGLQTVRVRAAVRIVCEHLVCAGQCRLQSPKLLPASPALQIGAHL